MLKLFSSKTQKMVGLDFSASSVKLLELGKQGDTYCIQSYAVEPLPPEAIDATTIKDVEAVGKAIAAVVARSRTTVKLAAIVIHNAAVITKTIQMSASLKEQELATQISFEADRYIPYPLQEINLDFQVLGPNPKNASVVDVLLVGTKTDNVDARIEALALGGLTAKVVDVEAYAVERAFGLIIKDLPKESKNETVAIIDIGAVATTLCVLCDGKSVYVREQNFGGQQLTEEIQRRYNLSAAEAMMAQRGENELEGYQSEILNPFKFVAVQQVSRALQFFFSSGSFAEIDTIVLAGRCATMPGLATLIQEQLGIPTIIANPISQMIVSPTVDVARLQEDACGLLLCCGLAMRSFIDGY